MRKERRRAMTNISQDVVRAYTGLFRIFPPWRQVVILGNDVFRKCKIRHHDFQEVFGSHARLCRSEKN